MNSIQLNINLSFEQLLEAVKQLSPEEKMTLHDAIWDENIEIPREQQALIVQRKKDAKENLESMLDWDQASKTLISS